LILRSIPAKTNSFLKSIISKPSVSIIALILVFLFLSPASASISVEIGFGERVIRQVVESPNMAVKFFPPSFWSVHTQQVLLEAPSRVAGSPLAPPRITELRKKFPHLIVPANQKRPSGPDLASAPDLNGVVATGEGGPISIFGGGGATRVAKSDGPVTIFPYLYTRAPAWYIVRLFDVSGQEILFNGKPMFWWFRPDDSSNSPLFFKGRMESGSMNRVKEGDYSPKEGLKYDFEVKKDQRIEVQTKGKPEDAGFIKVESPSF